MADFDPRELRSALASYMTGVTVVTARNGDGLPVGFTANSFTSVSLNPPLLLVCPGNHLSSFSAFAAAKHFAVNILAEGQESISNIFASSKDDRFAQVGWQVDEAGCPLIDGAAAQFSCATYQSVDAGDHIVLIGRITGFHNAQKAGLGYCQHGYFSLNQERQSEAPATSNTRIVAAALVEHEGQICVQRRSDGFHLPSVEVQDRSGARSAISKQLSDLHLKADLGPVYSVFDDPDKAPHVTVFRAKLAVPPKSPDTELWPVSAPKLATLQPPANPVMMRRFQQEFSNNQFGLYIGDADHGEVHHPNPATI